MNDMQFLSFLVAKMALGQQPNALERQRLLAIVQAGNVPMPPTVMGRAVFNRLGRR